MTAPEFLDVPVPGDESEDVLDTTQGRRVPPWLIAVAVGALVFVAVVVEQHNRDTRSVAARPQPSRTVPFPPPRAPDPAIRRLNGTVLEIYTRAHDNEPAQDIVRTGAESQCKGVRIGAVPPQATAARAMTAGLRGFRLIDAARILDQNAGLCALQVRGRNSAGAVIVLTVTSPTVGAPAARAVFHRADTHVQAEVVRYVQLRTPVGWVVTLGAVGPGRDLPAAASLAALAGSPRLRW